MAKQTKKTAQEVADDKATKIMEGVAYWGAFYRKNPQRFAKDYLNIDKLKVFQKILLYVMMVHTNFCWIAARGMSKTWTTALFCVIRCILFPKTKIVVASGTRGQANEVLSKIEDDFMKNYTWGSANLRNEIESCNIGQNKAEIIFKNGSWIKVATASDNARGMRANLLILDEFRMIDFDTINTVLRKFLTAPRDPGYLKHKEYEHLKERNIQMYMSSAWYQSHWSFEHCKSYFKNMMEDKKYFICFLPYQLSILEGLLFKEDIEDEMSEATFDEVKFSMEMEALFYSDANGSFFKFKDLEKTRVLTEPFYPLEYYENNKAHIPDVMDDELRILSVDIALLSSKKRDNDASSLIITRNILTGENEYTSNPIYLQNYEGLTTDELGLYVMKTFYKFKCTHLVLDYNGLGIGVLDFIIKDQFDPSSNETYKALNVCNNDELAERCKVKDALQVVYAIKGTASLNNEMCHLLRSGIQNRRINLLTTEYRAEEDYGKSVKGYKRLSPREHALLISPHLQTTLLVNELINLEYEVRGDNVRIYEKSGMRKDRYSSLGYNYYVLNIIANQRVPKIQGSKHDIAKRYASRIKTATRNIKGI